MLSSPGSEDSTGGLPARSVKSAAVFVGSSGLGPWQELEIEAFLRRFVKQRCPVIPVLLADAPQQPQLPIFLQGHMWVDFRQLDPNPMVQLIWGITGKKPPGEPGIKPPSIIQTQPFEFETATLGKNHQIHRSGGRGKSFKEDLGNGVILEMVAIPGGNFIMGSPENELGRMDTEGPRHNVTIQPFFMGKFPVTHEQYQAIMGKNPSYFKGKKRPVECVSWYDAVEFCDRISNRTGKTYRLPSEAEWEYACRAGTTTPFYFGETITTDLVNYDGNYTYGSAPKGQYRKQTIEVGSFPANAFGLYDMHGNVWEWCQDTWHDSYKAKPITDGRAWVDNENNYRRVLRGDSWGNHPLDCRSAYRADNYPDGGDGVVGLRVVCVGLSPRTLQ